MKRTLALYLCLLSVFVSGAAQADTVDDVAKAEMQKQHIPGLSLAVVRAGKVIKAKGYGFANLELNVPATPQTVFLSGSVGKQFTAAAIMLLVEDGKLALDEKLSKYLPGTPESWKDITIRRLLTHTSGITDYQPDIDFKRDYTDTEMIQTFAKYPLDFPTGDYWSYSNLGYVTLGILIKQVTGKFYGDFLKERVFTPLGMTNTRVYSESDLVPNRAAGYYWIKDGYKNQEYVTQNWNQTADGSLLFTVLDMAKWDAALYSKKLLKQSTLDALWTPVKLNNGYEAPYGFGWSLGDYRGRRLIEHGGAWLGFKTQISRYVDDKLTVIVLANAGGADPTYIAQQVAACYLPQIRLSAIKPQPDPDSQRTERLKAILTDFAKGAKESLMMSPALLATRSGTARDKGSRAGLLLRLASVKTFTYITEDDVQARNLTRRGVPIRRIVYCKLTTDKAAFLYRFYLTERGQVADIVSERE